MQLLGDQIRAVVVEPGASGFRVYEAPIRPKDRFFKRLIDRREPDIIGVPLREIFPGHSLKIADDSEREQRKMIEFWPRWRMSSIDDLLIGNAVIYGISKSEPVSATVSVEEVRKALQNVY